MVNPPIQNPQPIQPGARDFYNDAKTVSKGIAGGVVNTHNFVKRQLGSAFWLIVIFALYAMDWFVYFDGVDVAKLIKLITFNLPFWKSVFGAFFLIPFILYVIFQKPDKEEAISLFIALALTSFIINGLGLGYGPALIHLLFAIFFYFYVLIPGTDSRSQALYLYSAILIVDFFLFSILAYTLNNPILTRFMFPFIFFIGLRFTEDGWIKKICITFFVFLYVLQVSSTVYAGADIMGSLNEGNKVAYVDSLKLAGSNLLGFKDNIISTAQGQINKTKNDLNPTYATEIDKDTKRDLGIIVTLDTSYPRKLSENSSIIVYANIKGRNLIDEENFQGNSSCYAINERDPKTKIYGTINNEKEYIFEMNYYDYERSLTCKILDAKKGYYKVYFITNVQSETSAYMTSYFIDKNEFESIKPILDEKRQDIFQYLGIVNQKNSKSSAGLAQVGIGTKSSPIVVSDNSMSDNYFGISITARTAKLLEVEKLTVRLPIGVSFTNCEVFELEELVDTGELVYVSKEDEFKGMDLKQGFSKRCDLILDSSEELLYNNLLSKHYYNVVASYISQITKISEDIVVS